MLAVVLSHAPLGIEGQVVAVEVDLRRGIPGIDLVGLPDSAVRESRERVRVAIRNSRYRFPTQRILVNLAPAGMRKEGASFDLSIALGVLAASEQIASFNGKAVMVLGELNLSGGVTPVKGVLPAVASGLKHGIQRFLVPRDNIVEARALKQGLVWGIGSLAEAVVRLNEMNRGASPPPNHRSQSSGEEPVEALFGDLADLKGHWILKRALELAAAGRHNLFLFGPPGSGKTMAAKRLATLLPVLTKEESLEVTRIHSIAGLLPKNAGLISRRPFRMPHHSASNEGLVGGGRYAAPGEVSLAHCGVLFLDEASEFRQNLLQSLREPVEEGKITIVRAGLRAWYPAAFQLVMAANSCPCGNLGRNDRACLCTGFEVQRHWKRIGGALLDRMDIRVPLKPVPFRDMMGRRGETSRTVRERVKRAVDSQADRYRHQSWAWNSRIPAGRIEEFCALDSECIRVFASAVDKLSLSSRACHSIVKLARTISDLKGREKISKDHVLEAVQHRRYGEQDPFWNCG